MGVVVVFKRILGAFGVGAPSVDTVLSGPRVEPGGVLAGDVRLKGGDFDAHIEHITLGLVAHAQVVPEDDVPRPDDDEFLRVQVSGPFTLRAGEELAVPFEIEMPWESPISEVRGGRLAEMALGVRTELAIAKAVDKGDLDPLAVEPLPSQMRVLEALLSLGFQVQAAELELGYNFGVSQELPFYQVIAFAPPPRLAEVVDEVDLTFVADPAGLLIILDAVEHVAGQLPADAGARFQVGHEEALGTDWDAELGRWLAGLTGHGAAQGAI
ncbi:sporulation protein [Sphaerisporangium album]|uniref:sporulation protein n=1 Tax=Sphaerisporangium album TaxID=509200 RepID=UPI001FE38FFD|nr:sporulation protein [Sphaerisporangium album]